MIEIIAVSIGVGTVGAVVIITICALSERRRYLRNMQILNDRFKSERDEINKMLKGTEK